MGFIDSLTSAFSSNRIHYVLPREVDLATAPSHITIDGFATLKAETTRYAGDNKFQALVDETIRQPMRATVVGADHPAVAAQQSKATNASLWAVFCGASLMMSAVFTAATAPIWAAACFTVGVLLCLAGFLGEPQQPRAAGAPAAA